MSPSLLNKYLFLLNGLLSVRDQNGGKESPEEDNILTEMDSLWGLLTEEEKKIVNDIPSIK